MSTMTAREALDAAQIDAMQLALLQQHELYPLTPRNIGALCALAKRALAASLPSETPRGDTAKSNLCHDELLRTRQALEQAVRIIRVWHAMPQKPGDDDAFDLYFNHSPEMKPIRDVLGKMPEDANGS